MQFTVPAVSANRVAAHMKQVQEDVCNVPAQARADLFYYIYCIYVRRTLIKCRPE